MELPNFSVSLGEVAEPVQVAAYKDGLSQPVRAASLLTEDVIKTGHLLLFPIQFAAAFQDRLRRYIDRIRDAVPPDRQVNAAPEVVGPAIQNLQFISDGNKLEELYLSLLISASDSSTADEVHPGFVHILERLSPQDAVFFWHIHAVENDGNEFVTVKLIHENKHEAWIGSGDISSFQVAAIDRRSRTQLRASVELLESQTLITSRAMSTTNHQVNEYEIRLTNLGRLFAKICLPSDFDAPKDPGMPSETRQDRK